MIHASVLVVEDERVVALHLKQQLTRLGYRVPAMATSGQQALKEIQEHRPDVVLMDVHIEGPTDGIDTAASIPADFRIPVIYLTAYSEEVTLERARGTRPYGYLLKPFSERELHASLQMVLERRRADALAQETERRLEALVAARTAEVVEQTARRVQAERDLLQIQKLEAVGQLSGGIAHDFNNLLTVIIGNLSRIERRTELPIDEIRRSAASAMRASQKAATLTQRLLAFSRRQPLNPRPLNVNQFVSTMSDTLQRTLGESVAIETALAGDLWPVSVDVNQLESAILNLALNARDAMPHSGKLTVETLNARLDEAYCATNQGAIPGEYVALSVSDTGCGMTPEVAGKAFEPFFTTKDVGEGTGLGLSQVYGFIKQSGGHVAIYSEPGNGTTMKLYLPRLDSAVPQEYESEDVATPPRGLSTEIILLVEDDEEVRASASSILRELGYSVLEAPEASTALEIVRGEQPISLLFTDVGLPGGTNGRQLADEATRLRPGLRIVFTTGYARNAIVHHGRLDPGIDLLTKPFTFAALAIMIRNALDR
jgi:signal transduction histidine kinase